MATLAERASKATAHIKGFDRVDTLDFGGFHKATVMFTDENGNTRAVSQRGATQKQAEVAALEHVVAEFYTCHACGRVME